MVETDFAGFVEMLDAVYALHSKSLPAPAKVIFFRAMTAYPITAVRAAIDAHVRDAQRGQFPPKPADLIAQIEDKAADDGRPGPDEAWAMAMQSRDEAETIITTREVAEAFEAVKSVLCAGDEVGARMAFRETYGRIVARARVAGEPVRWFLSQGTDPERRKEPIRKAVAMGRLSSTHASALLPKPDATGATAKGHAEGMARVRAALAGLNSPAERLRRAAEQRLHTEREHTKQAKRAAANAVRERSRDHH